MRVIDLQSLLGKRYRWGNRQELWKNKKLKEDFRDASFNRCWYTEVKLLGQDAPIDHFRPKAKVKQFEDYNYNQPLAECGYFWLSQEPQNYRLSCTYANRKTGKGGKGCFFPLTAESPYMTRNGNEEEKALLIDPCVKEDISLISFMGNKVVAASEDEMDIARVNISKRIFNLDEPFIKAERGKVWTGIEKTLAEYDSGDISKIACLRILNDYISPNAQFSACAIACINSLAPDDIKEELDLEL